MHILCIDDDLKDVDELVKRLKARNVYIETFIDNAEKAIEHIKERPNYYDYVIVDVFLNNAIDGFDVIDEITKLQIDDRPKIILFTKADDKDIDRIMGVFHIDNVIRKDFSKNSIDPNLFKGEQLESDEKSVFKKLVSKFAG